MDPLEFFVKEDPTLTSKVSRLEGKRHLNASKDLKASHLSLVAKQRSLKSKWSGGTARSTYSQASSIWSGRSSISSSSSITSVESSIYGGSDSFNIASLRSIPIKHSKRSIACHPPPLVSELEEANTIAAPSPEPFSYELPCEFDYLGCHIRFQPHEYETWISHTISHFVSHGPPPKASCTICPKDYVIFESSRRPYDNWRERMFHIGNHFQKSADMTVMRRDPLVFEYMLNNGIVFSELAVQSLDINKSGEKVEETLKPSSASDQNRDQSKLREIGEDSTCSSLHEKDTLVRQECRYIVLGQDNYGETCNCAEFIENASKPAWCDCGHRGVFHQLRERQQTPEADQDQEHKIGTQTNENRNITEVDTNSKGKAREEYLSEVNSDDEVLGHPSPVANPSESQSPVSLGKHDSSISIPAIVSTTNIHSPKLTSALPIRVNKRQVLLARDMAKTPEARPSPVCNAQNKHNHPGPSHSSGVNEIRNGLLSKSSMVSFVTATGSVDDTDWEEDSDSEVTHKPTLQNQIDIPYASSETLHLVDREMKKLLYTFNNQSTSGTTQNGESSTTPSPGTNSAPRATQSSNSNQVHGTKRPRSDRDDRDDDNPNDEDGRRSKQPGTISELPITLESNLRFACPYRKHNPRKYCVNDWKLCALNHHKTVARVKAHLYRYHLIHQCQRCKVLFDSELDLDMHIEAQEACELKPAEQVDGITRKLKQQIQSRKRAHPEQTEAEKWQQIYRMLFPGEIAPDPYFDPVIDQTDSPHQISDTGGLSSHEEFLREETSRRFQEALKTEFNLETQPLEEPVRAQLLNILEKAQKQAFDSLHQITTSDKSSSATSVSAEQEYFFRTGSELLKGNVYQAVQPSSGVSDGSTTMSSLIISRTCSSRSGLRYSSNMNSDSNSGSTSEIESVPPAPRTPAQETETPRFEKNNNKPSIITSTDTVSVSIESYQKGSRISDTPGGPAQPEITTTQDETFYRLGSPFDFDTYLNADDGSIETGSSGIRIKII